jgi:Fe2+ transport system protein B
MSKCELPEAVRVRDTLAEALGREVLAISAVTGEGLDTLLRAVVAALDRREATP